MATYTQTWGSNGSVTIPSAATNVTYSIHGGKGASGGPCNTRLNLPSGASGARGQKISGTLKNVAGQTLTLTIGGNGSGVGLNRDTGGSGGGGFRSGGDGGDNNSSDNPDNGWNSGAGGGGGGATTIRLGSTVIVGAGGGGGGACICFASFHPEAGTTSNVLNTCSIFAADGIDGTSSGGSYNGGAGGGGGGFPGGAGGTAYNSGNDCSGEGGQGGEGYWNSDYHDHAYLDTSDGDVGYITIAYNYNVPASPTNNATNGSLLGIDSWYRSTYPSGYSNWNNHIHTTLDNELDGDWTKYFDNEFYFFEEEDGNGTNGETMKQVNRYYSGFPTDNHLLATTDAAPDSSYADEGKVGYIYQNSGTNRTALYRFRKQYTASSGYGQASITKTLTTVVCGRVKRVQLLSSDTGATGGVINCTLTSTNTFCYVDNGRDTNQGDPNVGCRYPSSGYTDIEFSNVSGTGSGLKMHMAIIPINGSGGKPNNMRVQYPGRWFNSGGGTFGEGGVYVDGGSGYSVGDVLNPITTCPNMGTASINAFKVIEVGFTTNTTTQTDNYDRIDHRCGTDNINGIDGWVLEGIMGYVPSPRDGCTDPGAGNYDPFATNDDGNCTYVSGPNVSNFGSNLTSPAPTQTFTLSWDVDDGGSSITQVKLFNLSTGTTDTLANNATEKSYSFPAGTADGTSYQYKIRVTNSEGSDEETVTVTCGIGTTATFTADQTSFISGDSVELDWAVVGAYTSLSVTGVTNPAAVGDATFEPQVDTTYTLTLTGDKVPNGSLTIDIPITVYQAASINTFSFDTPLITSENTSVILSWNVTGDVDTINISPALPGYTTSTNFAKSGSVTFTYPNVETTYTITASGDGVAGASLTRDASIPIDFYDGSIAENGIPKTWNIPKRAQQVTVTIAAAKGGVGANDAGGSGGDGGKGRGGIFVLPFRESAYDITISPGSNGGDGTDNGQTGGGGGASGGAGYPNGGNGGNSGPRGWSGGGGGGGGASHATDSFVDDIILIAGGGGGGGGASLRTGKAGNGDNGTEWNAWNQVTQGSLNSNLNPGDAGAQNPDDGGGGGGGGGGAGVLGGGGGSYGSDKSSKAGGGGGGDSYFRAGSIISTTSTFVNNGAGYGQVTYIPSDWIPDAFSITPQNPTPAPGPGDTVISNYFTITGINYPIRVKAVTSGAQIQKVGTNTWSTSLPAVNDDEFRVRFKTPTSGGVNDQGYSVVSSIVIQAGLLSDEPDDVVSSTWEVTTGPPDITPDAFSWTDSVENTPALNSNIESENITITDFDIPLEIKSNYPIQVQIGNDGIWRDVGQIT